MEWPEGLVGPDQVGLAGHPKETGLYPNYMGRLLWANI